MFSEFCVSSLVILCFGFVFTYMCFVFHFYHFCSRPSVSVLFDAAVGVLDHYHAIAGRDVVALLQPAYSSPVVLAPILTREQLAPHHS